MNAATERSIHELPVSEAAAALATDVARGLSADEARARLERFGANELAAEPPVPTWRRFVRQFADSLVVLLLVATAVSATLWAIEPDAPLPYEAMAILAVVILNAIMGYLQESRAEAAVAALDDLVADHATVVRDAVQRRIPARELVPGDLVLVEEGDTVPADARIVAATALQAAEAALTGESLPVMKQVGPVAADAPIGDRLDMLFSGTAIASGRGRAMVAATGMRTEMGTIARMLGETPVDRTPLQRELDRTGRLLGLVVVAIAVVMVATILLVERVEGMHAIFDVLILGVALAVAAVPEGLPAVVTAVLSIGVQRMARRNAIIRHLSAVESLGSASIIASDKTGTLTRNEMAVRVVATASGRVRFEGSGYEPTGAVVAEGGGAIDDPLRAELVRALAAADRASNSVLQQSSGRWSIQGDPTEGALIVAARKAGLEADALAERLARVGEIPFSSERKLMSTLHTDSERPERMLLFTKGAPDVLLARCTEEMLGETPRALDDARRAEILREIEEMAQAALRTLGVAARSIPVDGFDVESIGGHVEGELVFLGLIGMIDPPRPEAADAVQRARRAGIRPLMITGDHPTTAAVIARELGITGDATALSGSDIERMTDDELDAAVREVSVFARVDPSHKLRIVDALQRNGELVAMTGDGVNDAPALRSADIGIAMGITGTDVSKKAADMVLADDNFATIVAAVEEGRAIFDNIRKFLRYLLSSNIGEVLTMFLGVLLADVIGLAPHGGVVVLPLLATQILFINLITDGLPALALGVDDPSPGLMGCPPRPSHERVITPRMWRGIGFVGAIMAVGTLLVLDASLPAGLIDGTGNLAYAQTMAFTTLIFFQLFNVFNARSDERSAFAGLSSNRWLLAAIVFSLAMQVAVVYAPFMQSAFGTVAIDAGDWLQCAAVASSVLWLREAWKLVARWRRST